MGGRSSEGALDTAARTGSGSDESGRLGAELRAIYTVWQRDMLHFVREPARVIGSLAQPLLFWVVIGAGFDSTFAPKGWSGDFSYISFMYPGIIGLTILFTSIFSTISVIADREHGFLREILVSPAARTSIIVGKIMAGSTLAAVQAILLLVFAPVVGLTFGAVEALKILAAIVGISFGLTGMGLVVAWQMSSTQGFHMVMNFLMIPMWLLSGAVFPVAGVPGWMETLMWVNPLTYGVDALRGALASGAEALPAGMVQLSFSWNLLAIVFFVVLMVGLAVRTCQSDREG